MVSPIYFIDHERFWAKVEIRGDLDCWIWQARRSDSGYGLMAYLNPNRDGSKQLNAKAHRIAYELVKGEIEDESCVLHRCDVRACCNPTHLYLGDRKQNAEDRVQRSKSRSGLTSADVPSIRSRIARNDPVKQIAKDFDVTESCIYKIKVGRTWKQAA